LLIFSHYHVACQWAVQDGEDEECHTVRGRK
jgi:hypothetical protein